MTSKDYFGWKLSKAELARHLGITPQAIALWSTPPDYALAYINLYNDHENLKKKVKEFGESI